MLLLPTKLLVFIIMLILLQQLTVPKKYIILVDKRMAESDISSKDSPVGEE